ncbi:uracil-DNA glycosylase [Uliginosibacterium sp. H1]|uniref:uracil-DNA glycosylase n=1 Tax=Uliginosibacterium sp. H1 TaxID=3114757 RepID=UPI003FCC9B21
MSDPHDPKRARLLAEMGIKPLWRLRDGEAGDGAATAVAVADAVVVDAPAEVVATPLVATPRAVEQPATVRPPAPAMPVAPQRPPATPASVPAVVAPAAHAAAVASMDWDTLRQTVLDCRACGLCKQRKQAVFGVGDQQADWMFVGEGPGAEEDERGDPFVGQAGKLLDNMLAAIDLKRGQDVYIANAVKCRPPGNRTPEPHETAACHPYLARQVELLQPRLIVALGRPAAQTLLNEEIKISAARGKRFQYMGVPVVVTYHPAYLLRNLTDKSKAWEDLCFAQDLMAELKA